MCFGGGASAPATQTVVQQQQIPQYQQQFAQQNQDLAREIAARPFPTYEGQRIAGWDPQQAQAYALTGQNAGTNLAGYQGQQGAAAGATAGVLGSRYGSAVTPQTVGQLNGLPFGGYDRAGQLAELPIANLMNAPGSFGGSLNPTLANGPNAPQSFARHATAQMFDQSMTPDQIAPWMSPFVEQALQPQLQDIQRQSALTANHINAGATAAGAFGDARLGIQQGENDRNTAQIMSNAVGTGYSSAYDRAVASAQNAFGQNLSATQANNAAGQNAFALNAGQFNAEQAARLANYNAGLAATGQNNQARLGAFNANAGQFNSEQAARQATYNANLSAVGQAQQAMLGRYNANLAGTQANNTSQRAANSEGQNALLGQFNANLAGTQANNAAGLAAFNANAGQFNSDRAANLGAASQLSGMAGQQYGLNQQAAQDLFNMGQQNQQQGQQGLSTAYQDYLNQFEYPQEMLNLRLATLQGSPYNTTRLTTQPYSPTAQSIGGLAALLGLGGNVASGGLFGSRPGG